MKKFTLLLTLFVITFFAQAALSQSNYDTYGNARFGYSISYPSNLLKPQGEAENGDGQVFTGEGAEMRVFGSNMLLNGTLRKEYNAIIKEKGAAVTYKLLKNNSFTVSGKADGRIFYQKTFKNAAGSFATFMIEYDESKRSVYDKAVTQIVKSFK